MARSSWFRRPPQFPSVLSLVGTGNPSTLVLIWVSRDSHDRVITRTKSFRVREGEFVTLCVNRGTGLWFLEALSTQQHSFIIDGKVCIKSRWFVWKYRSLIKLTATKKLSNARTNYFTNFDSMNCTSIRKACRVLEDRKVSSWTSESSFVTRNELLQMLIVVRYFRQLQLKFYSRTIDENHLQIGWKYPRKTAVKFCLCRINS